MVGKTNQIKHFIVDLDETIIHLQANWAEVRKVVAEKMIEHGLTYDTKASLDSNLFALRRAYPQAFAQLLPLIARMEQERLTEAPVHHSLVEELAAAPSWALFTANVRATAQAALSLNALKRLKPELIVAKDDVDFPKPHPFGALKILKALNWEPSQTLYIGDSQNDAIAAAAAGLHFRKVTYF